jgi:GNAT superfamily N-acetyltransferase
MSFQFEVIETPIIDSLDHPDAWIYRGMETVGRENCLAGYGYTDFANTAEDHRSYLLDQPHQLRASAVAADGHRVLGYVKIVANKLADLSVGESVAVVNPNFQNLGIGNALAEWGEAKLRSWDRSIARTFADPITLPKPGEPQTEAASGGSVPTNNPSFRFALNRGYQLVQIDKQSTLTLPIPQSRIEGWRDAAAGQAAGYQTHIWENHVPNIWMPGYANLMTKTSTDIPQGDLTSEEDIWTPERAARFLEEKRERYDLLFAAATLDHELVGITYLSLKPGHPEYAMQEFTIVLGEHRGHQLGMLLKSTNLLALMQREPQLRRIHTWNADENSHMLAINSTMGFKLATLSAAMEKNIG